MVEEDARYFPSRHPLLDWQYTGAKVYELLTLFMASKSVSELCTDDDFDPFGALQSRFQDDRIVQLFVELAVNFRLQDDLVKQWRGTSTLSKFIAVGVLCPDASKPDETQDLSFRESCNKLIHMVSLHFDGENLDEPHDRYLHPRVHLIGKHQRRTWKARLEVVDWVRAATNLLSD